MQSDREAAVKALFSSLVAHVGQSLNPADRANLQAELATAFPEEEPGEDVVLTDDGYTK